ncbi:alpha/beta hydrolase [Marinospirillum sp. MEB164]|uniref:Alpha/beta hydrolase n=1 Tax=Marinospirillum alkalitolerans TaxID=3123374 RepID=A0ABW8Q0I9_9GAMM
MRPFLHFAHANGFPAGSYQQLLGPLSLDYQVLAIDRLGHQPQYPIAPNWKPLAQELLDYLQQQAGDQPVIGIGHSLGGVVTYMAALEQPERFQQIILLDPPLMFGSDSWGLKVGKRFGFIDRITPAGITRGRRSHWPDLQAAEDNLRTKKLFRHFDPQALRDYLQAGTEPAPQGGIQLRFQPQVELAIFRHLADHLTWSHRRLKVPTHLFYGLESQLLNAARRKRIEARGISCSALAGGHMFPLEHPEATRQALLKKIAEQAALVTPA